MGILTTLAIIGGITLLVGGATTVGVYYATADDRAKARVAELETEISNCDTIINNFKDLKSKLNSGKSYLATARLNFKNGGHSLDGVPLASSEFSDCINKIDNAISNINAIIKGYENDQAELIKEKRNLKKKYNL